jgi:F420-dependent oxidoreductase-like protein
MASEVDPTPNPGRVRLGLALGYWGGQPPPGVGELVLEAERLGFDSVWTSEAYGSDALTPLAWWGARTSRLRLGTAVAQLHGRTAAATAMAAATLDHLSGGRLILGLGVSGPQVVEGWHGAAFEHPLSLTREYVEVVRRILAREGPVEFQGRFIQLPLPGGRGKPLQLTVHPLRPNLPIWLGAEGPRNIALAAEIADGWLAGFHSPERSAWQATALEGGFRARLAPSERARFEIAASLPLVVDDEVERAADQLRPQLALYIGGMGSRSQNFHFNLFARMGFEAAATTVRDLYLSGLRREAAAAVPTELVEAVALVGPLAKVREEATRWRRALPSLLLVSGPEASLRTAAELFL